MADVIQFLAAFKSTGCGWIGGTPLKRMGRGMFGEGYLRQVKGEANQGLRPGWEEALLKRLYLKKGLANVRGDWKDQLGETAVKKTAGKEE